MAARRERPRLRRGEAGAGGPPGAFEVTAWGTAAVKAGAIAQGRSGQVAQRLGLPCAVVVRPSKARSQREREAKRVMEVRRWTSTI
jgi:hypothetical protein